MYLVTQKEDSLEIQDNRTQARTSTSEVLFRCVLQGLADSCCANAS